MSIAFHFDLNSITIHLTSTHHHRIHLHFFNMADAGNDDRPLPDLAATYALYDNDELEAFIDAATELLEESIDLNRYHTIHLLTLLANSVESPDDCADYYHKANWEYQLAIASRDAGESVAATLEELGAKLALIRQLVDKNTTDSIVDEEEEEEEEEEEGAEQPLSLMDPRFGFHGTGEGQEANVDEVATDAGAEKKNEKNESEVRLTLTSRV